MSTTRWIAGRTTRVSGGTGCSPPRAGAGVPARGGAAGRAVAEPSAPPDPSAGTAGPSFLIPPAGEVFSLRGAAAGCRDWGAAGGGCRDPPGTGPQPSGVPLGQGVAGWGPPHFHGRAVTDGHARPSPHGLGGPRADTPKGEELGVPAGGRRGGSQPRRVAGGGDSRQPGWAPLPAPAGWPCACVLPAPLLAPGPAARSLRGGPAPEPPPGF